VQDPLVFIGFREAYAYAVNGCQEGITTIEVLGLNRKELVEVRGERLVQLKDLVLLRDLLREKVTTNPLPEYLTRLRSVEATLHASQQPTGQYSAMARAFLTP
jgi:hypothetical protein